MIRQSISKKQRWLPLFLCCIMMSFLFGCTGAHKKNAPSSRNASDLQASRQYAIEMNEGEDSLNQCPGETDDPYGAPDAIDAVEEDPASIEIQAHLDEALDYYQASQDFWQQGELENAMQALDQAYTLILEVDTFDLPKFNQQKDDLRFMISKRILEIYTSRHNTAKGNHNAIPLVLNSHVQQEIDLLTSEKGKCFFINAYKRSGRYRPYIVSELKKAGLPEELSWLPLIESGFKVNALSSARALGLWQFIASTGHKFGLKRNEYVDERLDPFKATLAAIDYLKELHEIFGDWPTVLAAYNCGEGRVLRTIRDQNVNYLDDFWDLYKRLPSETARYVPKFMATIHILNNMDKYGMSDIVVDEPVAFETVTVSKQVYLKDVAETIHLQEKCLVDLNPELRYKLLPPEEYALKIPADRKEMLLARIDDIPFRAQVQQYVKKQTPAQITYHKVRHGETLSSIASQYNISLTELTRYNKIYKTNHIAVGKFLKIPHAGAVTASASAAPSSKRENVIKYRVRQGDSLWTLAKRYNTTTKHIQQLNKLNSSSLSAGQSLKIPSNKNTQGTQARNELKVYKVRSGDSPAKIASKHRMNLSHLLSLNNLKKNSRIYPGQRLYVK